VATALASAATLRSLEVLYEAPDLSGFDLPDELAAAYGSRLGFREPRLYANFVASVDGVVALPDKFQSSHTIAGASEGDRFVMGLLRACADAILVGAGTLHASPRTLWTAEHAYPPAAPLYAELRRRRDRPPQPTLAVLSGSGSIDPWHPALARRTLVLTSEQGASRLGDRLPTASTMAVIGNRPILDPVAAVEALRAGGHEHILCEGGPTLFGALTAAGLVDELFLTVSPLLAGRSTTEWRLSLLEGVELLPGRTVGCKLLSMRRAGSHLFLRYELDRGAAGRRGRRG
jgi:riboflavin biosynthesis pyrimidine reductase